MLSSEWVSAAENTVVHMHRYLNELKQQAIQLADSITPADRAYFTADEDDRIVALLFSYRQSRQALLDLVGECRRMADDAVDDYDTLFLVAFAGASVLVDAGRFLREVTEGRPNVRRKLNQPAPSLGIPGGTYDTVQRSLIGGRNAWYMFRAIQYYDANASALQSYAGEYGLGQLLGIVQQLRHRLDVTFERFAKAKLRTRSDQWLRASGRVLIVRTIYGIQKMISTMMSDVYVRAGHAPRLPEEVIVQLQGIVRPGDVLVVRKEYAITNYFLPGYWPHAALYLGPTTQLQELGLHEHTEFTRRWQHFSDQPDQRRVLESLKDGVRIRPWSSPLSSDSLVVLRPQLDDRTIARGLTRVIRHEGKPYDFDFDFGRSDRLVCTEVIYRAYDGLGGLRFPLTFRAGRPNLSGGDLIAMAHEGRNFEPICCYAPRFSRDLLQGPAIRPVLAIALGIPV